MIGEIGLSSNHRNTVWHDLAAQNIRCLLDARLRGLTMGMGAAVEPRTGTKQLAPSVLAHARAQGRAGGPALHRRGGARPVAVARLSHRNRLAAGSPLRRAPRGPAPRRP